MFDEYAWQMNYSENENRQFVILIKYDGDIINGLNSQHFYKICLNMFGNNLQISKCVFIP